MPGLEGQFLKEISVRFAGENHLRTQKNTKQSSAQRFLNDPFPKTPFQKTFRYLLRFYSLLFRGFFRVFFRGFFVALFCLEKQCSGLFRYFFVAFSWLFRGPCFGQILRVLALEQSSDLFSAADRSAPSWQTWPGLRNRQCRVRSKATSALWRLRKGSGSSGRSPAHTEDVVFEAPAHCTRLGHVLSSECVK